MVFGWGWDGSQCAPIVGCLPCEGSDCNERLARRSLCQSAYAHCVPEGGP
jgi:hypothetical protein